MAVAAFKFACPGGDSLLLDRQALLTKSVHTQGGGTKLEEFERNDAQREIGIEGLKPIDKSRHGVVNTVGGGGEVSVDVEPEFEETPHDLKLRFKISFRRARVEGE